MKTYPSIAIKIFIALGVIFLIGIASLPFFFVRMVDREERRFHACQKHERADCRPSAAWIFYGWQGGGAATSTD